MGCEILPAINDFLHPLERKDAVVALRKCRQVGDFGVEHCRVGPVALACGAVADSAFRIVFTFAEIKLFRNDFSAL